MPVFVFDSQGLDDLKAKGATYTVQHDRGDGTFEVWLPIQYAPAEPGAVSAGAAPCPGLRDLTAETESAGEYDKELE